MGSARHALDAARRVEGAGARDGIKAWGYRKEINVSRESRQKTRKALFGAVFRKAARHAKRQVQAQTRRTAFRNQGRSQRGGVAHQSRRAGLPLPSLAAGEADPALAGIKAPIRMGGDHAAKPLAHAPRFMPCCTQDEGRA
jgi:hypothetical protein